MAEDAPGAAVEELSVSPSEAMDPPARRLSVGAIGKGPSGARQYRLLAPVARGGMGELYVAEQTDVYGKKLHVIVKRLLENLRGGHHLHQTRIEFGAAPLNFLQPGAVSVHLGRAIELFEQGLQELLLLAAVELSHFLRDFRDRPCHDSPKSTEMTRV